YKVTGVQTCALPISVFRLTPPVGTSGTCGSGPFRALMYFAPPTSPQGKILTKSDPALQAVITSVGVKAPAIISTPSRTANSTIRSEERRVGKDGISR